MEFGMELLQEMEPLPGTLCSSQTGLYPPHPPVDSVDVSGGEG